jgi:hypothetical protein
MKNNFLKCIKSGVRYKSVLHKNQILMSKNIIRDDSITNYISYTDAVAVEKRVDVSKEVKKLADEVKGEEGEIYRDILELEKAKRDVRNDHARYVKILEESVNNYDVKVQTFVDKYRNYLDMTNIMPIFTKTILNVIKSEKDIAPASEILVNTLLLKELYIDKLLSEYNLDNVDLEFVEKLNSLIYLYKDINTFDNLCTNV